MVLGFLLVNDIHGLSALHPALVRRQINSVNCRSAAWSTRRTILGGTAATGGEADPPPTPSSSSSAASSGSLTSIRNVNQLFRRCTWISWWVQVVLSVISSVILVFANTVRQAGGRQSVWSSGFSFSVIGVVICLLNCFWTWNAGRLSARVSSRKVSDGAVFPTMRQYCKVSVVIALVGMLVTLVSAEMIVGNLVSKTLLSSQVVGVVPVLSSTGVAQNTLQALDIFLVQANTNALVAHFAPLVCYLFLQTQIPQRQVEGGVQI